MANSTTAASNSAVNTSSITPGVGVIVGTVAIVLGLFIGYLYQKYLSPNYVKLLIDARTRKRNQKAHESLSNASQDSSTHGLVQLTSAGSGSATALESLSIDFDTPMSTVGGGGGPGGSLRYQPPRL